MLWNIYLFEYYYAYFFLFCSAYFYRNAHVPEDRSRVAPYQFSRNYPPERQPLLTTSVTAERERDGKEWQHDEGDATCRYMVPSTLELSRFVSQQNAVRARSRHGRLCYLHTHSPQKKDACLFSVTELWSYIYKHERIERYKVYSISFFSYPFCSPSTCPSTSPSASPSTSSQKASSPATAPIMMVCMWLLKRADRGYKCTDTKYM